MPTNVHKSLYNLRNKPYWIELKNAFLLLFANLRVHQEWIRESSHCNMHLQRRIYSGGPHFVKQHRIRECRLSAAIIPLRHWRYYMYDYRIICYGIIDNELITSWSSMPDLFASKRTFAIRDTVKHDLLVEMARWMDELVALLNLRRN